LAVADFDRDGALALAVANVDGNSVSILLGNAEGDGSFRDRRNFGVGIEPVSVALGNFFGGGMRDLAVANYAFNDVAILLNETPRPPR
jgi:hypothetical protein